MLGVFRIGLPRQARSPIPWSSVRTKMILGRVPFSGLALVCAMNAPMKIRQMLTFKLLRNFILNLFMNC